MEFYSQGIKEKRSFQVMMLLVHGRRGCARKLYKDNAQYP